MLPTEDDLAELRHDANQDAVNDAGPDDALSNCCGDPFYPDQDICTKCNEHAAAEIEVIHSQYGQHKSADIVTFNPVTLEIQEIE